MEKVCINRAFYDEQMNTWEQIKDLISARISEESFQNWLSKTVFLRASAGRLYVGVPDRETKDWIEQEYA
ncbi:MAG TPA: DnaA N-terminal domain-containing protein, partial [Bryobacteraceae bacterium]